MIGNFVFPWIIAKALVCFAIFLYIIFAFVVIRQIYLMTETLEGQLEIPLKTVGIVHFLVAILVLLIAIVIL